MAIIADLSGGSGGWSYLIVGRDITNSHNNRKQAQTFVVIDGLWNVTSVKLYLDRDFTAEGSPENGDLVLTIRADSPTGNILGTSSIERTTVPLSISWVEFPFSGVTLESGNTYCLVLSCSAGFYDTFGVGNDTIEWVFRSQFYSSGERYYYWDGLGWTWDSQHRDCRAIIYGEPSAPNKPINPSPTNNATEVDFSDFTLSWEDGGSADTYNVYIGTSGNLSLVSSAQEGTSYTTSLSELETIFALSTAGGLQLGMSGILMQDQVKFLLLFQPMKLQA